MGRVQLYEVDTSMNISTSTEFCTPSTTFWVSRGSCFRRVSRTTGSTMYKYHGTIPSFFLT